MAVQIPAWEGPILEERGAHCKVSSVSCAKTAELIDLPFRLWTPVGRKKNKFNRICQVASMCPHGRAHWRHLVNLVELSICSSDAVFGQITLTTCYCYYE